MAFTAEAVGLRYLVTANVVGLGACVSAYALRPTGDDLREEVQTLKARMEAMQRALRLARTVAVVAMDYKVGELRQNDDGSKQVRLAEATLRQAQDDHEKAGLAVQAAPYSGEAIENAKVARDRVLDAAAKLESLRIEHSQDDNGRRQQHQRNAERLLRMARQNGGCYLKVAQHLSQLDYMLPDEYIQCFTTCLDDAPRSSFGDVAAVLEEDFGGVPLTELFDDFQREPIASASLAQVHEATYKGQKVAVKVQHRGLRETSQGDLDACAFAVKTVAKVFPDFKLGWLIDEIAPHLPIELDFHIEAQNCERARQQFQSWSNVRVPTVISERSTARVCTMSFEPGVNGADRTKLNKLGIDTHAAADLAVRAFAASTFKHGFCHCDPHSANLLFAPLKPAASDPLLVLLDHGLYKELDDDFRLEYARLWRAIVLADTKAIATSSHLLGVGENLYPLFAAMLARKPWDDIANPDLNSLKGDAPGDAALIQAYAHRYLKEITLVLDQVPRQLLLLLKMSDCLRHLERNLVGGSFSPPGDELDDPASQRRPRRRRPRGEEITSSFNSHILIAHACAEALFAHDRDFLAFARVKLRLWAFDLHQFWQRRRPVVSSLWTRSGSLP